jgi:hypothetical protein
MDELKEEKKKLDALCDELHVLYDQVRDEFSIMISDIHLIR